MRTVPIPGDATPWPAIGLGTWRLGEGAASRRAEVAAVREALDLGYRLIDTAEMYGDGGAESIVGEAVAGALRQGDLRREDLRVVTKVMPHHASRRGTMQALDASRRRLGLDRVDLFLLHWPGPHPLADTLAAFDALTAAGAIGAWGVSNFDLAAMQRLIALPGGDACAANQIYLSLGERGADFDLRPWQRDRGLPTMAYSPIDQGPLAAHAGLAALAAPLGLTAAQLALAWVIHDGHTMAVPKAVSAAHQRDNLAAARARLDAPTLAELDRVFPPPRRPRPLAMI